MKRIIAVAQTIVGVVGTVAVILGYLSFSQPMRDALTQLDKMAQSGESQLETASSLLGDVSKVADGLQKALPAHRKTVAAAVTTAETLAGTIDKWNEDIPGYQGMATDASHIADTFAEQLPIKVPLVTADMEKKSFELPEIIPRTQTVKINVPTATVGFTTKSLEYPSGASVKTDRKSVGPAKFDIPVGIDIAKKSFDVRYPSSLNIGTKVQNVTMPKTPDLNMKEYSFHLPANVKFDTREMMKDEKVLLEKSSAQLLALNTTLGETSESLSNVSDLISGELVGTLKETDANLEETAAALTALREERIPTVIKDLGDQQASLGESRQLFTAISGVIPLVFIVIGVFTLAIAVSGAYKLAEDLVVEKS